MKKNTNRFPAVIFIRIFVVCVFFLKLLTTSLSKFFHVTVHKCVRIVFWRQYKNTTTKKKKNEKFTTIVCDLLLFFVCLLARSVACQN